MWITLTGFMAAGKSTVAEQLGRTLARPVAALDERVERASGLTIPELFAQRGEPTFRELELAELRALNPDEDWIVDAGGGLVAAAAAVELLRARGPVLWLDAAWETVADRLQGEEASGRPLAAGRETADLERLYRARLPLYARAADFRLRADDRSVDELTRLATRCVRAWLTAGPDQVRRAPERSAK